MQTSISQQNKALGNNQFLDLMLIYSITVVSVIELFYNQERVAWLKKG